MESIKKWFGSGCDYLQGVELYAGLANAKPVLLKNFRTKDCALNREKLKYELKKMVPAAAPTATSPVIPRQVKKEVAAPAPADVKQTVFYHQLPPELRPVLQEANALFSEMCRLKVSLNELAPEQEAEALALQREIFYKRRQNAMCWEKIDYWREHKRLPAAPAGKLDALGPAMLHKRQQQLFSSRSKLKKRLEKNIELLEAAANLKDKVRLERMVAKQKNNLLQQDQQIIELTLLIEAKHEQKENA